MRACHLDIVGVTETWLKSGVASASVAIPGYAFYRQDRLSGRGGGVGVYVRSDLRCERVQFTSCINVEGLECLWLRVRLPGGLSMAVGVLYRTGSGVLNCVNMLDVLLQKSCLGTVLLWYLVI